MGGNFFETPFSIVKFGVLNKNHNFRSEARVEQKFICEGLFCFCGNFFLVNFIMFFYLQMKSILCGYQGLI